MYKRDDKSNNIKSAKERRKTKQLFIIVAKGGCNEDYS